MDNSAETAPLLNNYKLEYFLKRLPQTILGGPVIKAGSGRLKLPVYIHIYQLIVFLMPLFIATIFTVIAETNTTLEFWMSIVYGCTLMIMMMVLHLILRTAHKKLDAFEDSYEGDDASIEFKGCFAVSTIIRFIIHQKKHAANICIHSLLYGLVSGFVFIYLLPNNAEIIFKNKSASILYFIFGWLASCIGLYGCLAQPPAEPAQFRITDQFEIASLSRIFYLGCFSIFGLIALFYNELHAIDYIARIVFAVLPIIWTFGIFPPVDCFFSWLGEQVLIHIFGGSSMANDLRLLIMLALSIICWIIVYAVKSTTGAVIVASAMGLFLSIDLCSLLEKLFARLTTTDKFQGETKTSLQNQSQKYSWYKILHFLLMLSSTIVITFLLEAVVTDTKKDELLNYFGYVLIALFVTQICLGSMQTLYVIFGVIRNPFYSFLRKGKGRKVVSLLRKCCINTVSPLVLVAFLTVAAKGSRAVALSNLLIALAASRAYRYAWQNQYQCLFDVFITMIVKYCSSGSFLWWNSLGIHLQLFIVSLIRARLQYGLSLASVYIRYTAKFYFSRKVRHQSYKTVALVTTALSPIFIGFFCVSVILYAPLLPLFTLPMFFIGFPRPVRFWPYADAKITSSSNDWIYYKQLLPPLTNYVKENISSGALGECLPGCHYLARFQDRIIWLIVVEKGYLHTNIIVKGLELAETSCHTAEAGRIDDIFDIVLEKASSPLLNPYLGHVLLPTDLMNLNIYSDAKNVLTGVIDSPDNLKSLSKHFVEALIWVLVRYSKERRDGGLGDGLTIEEVKELYKEKRKKNSFRKMTATTTETTITNQNGTVEEILRGRKSSSSQSKSSVSDNSLTALWNSKAPNTMEPVQLKSLKNVRNFDTVGLPAVDFAQANKKENTASKQNNFRGPNFVMDDDDFDDFGFDDASLTRTTSLHSRLSSNIHENEHRDMIDSIMDENSSVKSSTFNKRSTLPALVADVSSPHSSILEPPLRWKTSVPVEAADISVLQQMFPDEWFQFVLTKLGLEKKGDRALESISADRGLIFIFRKLVLSCLYVVSEQQREQSPLDVWRIFTGALPWSRYLLWLEEDPELREKVILAFRYAFKLMYDEAVLGPIDDFEELAEYLTDYEENWYMGDDESSHWKNAVLSEMPNLLSVGHDKETGTFTSRVLTKQKMTVPIGRLDSENVRAIWSSLSLELLYFTNDDEERYSIQSHPSHLRNITIQAADPPLGYPVYSSGLLNIAAWNT